MTNNDFITNKKSTFRQRVFKFYNLSEKLYEPVGISATNLKVRHIPTGKILNFRY